MVKKNIIAYNIMPCRGWGVTPGIMGPHLICKQLMISFREKAKLNSELRLYDIHALCLNIALCFGSALDPGF